MYRDIPKELRVLIEPVVEYAGFELVDVLVTPGSPPWLLRVTIDTIAGDGAYRWSVARTSRARSRRSSTPRTRFRCRTGSRCRRPGSTACWLGRMFGLKREIDQIAKDKGIDRTARSFGASKRP